MAYCGFCGRPLALGQKCSCGVEVEISSSGYSEGFWESMKNRMGIGDPELNKGDAFEKGRKIIPDCVKANEGEIPVKQYTVATLKNRILGIPYSKAVGRMQVTNKRVIFRAPGRCFAGRTTLQHEFAIDELAGIEARREYSFTFLDLFLGLVVALIGGFITSYLIDATCASDIRKGYATGPIFMSILFTLAGIIPFFFVKKRWLLKLLCLGGALVPLHTYGQQIELMGQVRDSSALEFFGGFMQFLALIIFAITLFALFLYAIRPNLVLLVKTKSAADAIDIRRKKPPILGGKDESHTGYTEVIPAEDAEHCIREINAMINDIQKLGDFGIDKWKA